MSSALTLPEFNVVKLKQSPRVQIVDYLREAISNGTLRPGVKLPSNQELAKRWGTHQTTVQLAMEALVKEGLLMRLPRVGTFVREREEKLTCVGVYCGPIFGLSPYSRAVHGMLKEELRKIGVEMDSWMDPRSLEECWEPWKPFIKAAKQRRFQAFVAVESNLPLLKWQQKLPVPTAFLANGVPTGVTNAIDQFIELSLQELARQGCRSVGLIAPVNPEGSPNPDGSSSTWLGMLEHFIAVAGDLNLQVKNSWMRTCPSCDWMQNRSQNQFGYEEFLQLWSQPEKPEGLVVFSDSVAIGTVMAVREKQVRVPEDLKLALHKNESIELFCPMPATFVVMSERDAARALIEQIQKQFRGESCEPIFLPFKLVTHNNLNP